MRIVLVHGFNIKDGGTKTIDKLVPLIQEAGWEVDKDEADYGYINIAKIVFYHGRARAKAIYRIAKAIEKGDVVIAHSNGANYVNQALGALPSEFDNSKIVIFISAALNVKAEVPAAVKAQLVLYTPRDIWVKLSSYLPFNPWGRMGARGYLGNSPKVVNIMDSKVKKHSQWFEGSFVRRTWQYIYHYVKEKTQ